MTSRTPTGPKTRADDSPGPGEVEAVVHAPGGWFSRMFFADVRGRSRTMGPWRRDAGGVGRRFPSAGWLSIVDAAGTAVANKGGVICERVMSIVKIWLDLPSAPVF